MNQQQAEAKAGIRRRAHSRRLTARPGSTTVLALLVSMLLIVLMLATMALTIADAELSQDYTRDKKTFQAAESGIAHGDIVLAHALSSFDIPSYTTPEDVTGYADNADAGHLDLLNDTGEYFYDDLYLYPEVPDAQGITEYSESGLMVDYASEVEVTPTSVDRPAYGTVSHDHVFHYDYEISSEGQANIAGQHHQATRAERGSFDVEVRRPSFATYGYFTQSTKNQYGSQLVFFDGEVYDGPTHVNYPPPEGRCGFYGQPIFNGPFTAVQESYQDSWLGGNADPIFNDTVTWGVDPVDVPANSWSQLHAVVGDYDNATDKTEPPGGWESYLIDWMDLPPETTELSQGVYYAPNYNEGASLLGGLLIWGDAESISFDAAGTGQQIITVTMNNTDGGQFDGSHTWRFRITTARTYVSVDGGSEEMYNDPLNGLIHTEGNILSLSGNGGSTPDIESDHEITVSATNDIYISDHITYRDDPIANPEVDNILGIFSSAGNIWLDRDAPSDLNLHATVMATGDERGIGAEGLAIGGGYDYGYPTKGNWNLLGGLIETKNQTTGVYYSNGHITGYIWNFTYDDRFAAGKAPPFFPYVTQFNMTLKNLQTTGWGRKYY